MEAAKHVELLCTHWYSKAPSADTPTTPRPLRAAATVPLVCVPCRPTMEVAVTL